MASKFFKNIFGIGKPKKPKGFKTPKPRPKPAPKRVQPVKQTGNPSNLPASSTTTLTT